MHCKKWIILLLTCSLVIEVNAQNINNVKDLKDKIAATIPILVESLETGNYKTLENLVLNDPGVYNEIWGRVYNSIRPKKEQLLFLLLLTM